MNKYIYLSIIAFFMLIFSNVSAQNNGGEISGVIKDAQTGETVPDATVVLQQNGGFVTGTKTDFNGKYSIKPIQPGTYSLRITSLGYAELSVPKIPVTSGKVVYINQSINSAEYVKDIVEIVEYRIPIIEIDQTQTGGTKGKEEIQQLASRSISSIVSTTAGTTQTKEGADINLKGTRSESTEYYVDGIKIRSSGAPNIPRDGIEEINVITGGIPAQYGDVAGGVISITTRGASKKFYGGLNAITSKLLDGFDYNLVSGNLSGPILKRYEGKDTSALLGYFLVGEYSDTKDPDPSAVGIFSLKEDVQTRIEDKPFQRNLQNNTPELSAEFLRASDFEKLKAKKNVRSKNLSLSGRLDFQPSKTSTVSLGVRYGDNNSNIFNYDRSLLNSAGNGQRITREYAAYARFLKSFSNVSSDEISKNTFTNWYFSLQADYTKNFTKQQDRNHRDKFFDYGYVGQFKTDRVRAYNSGTVDSNGIITKVQTGYVDTNVTFTRSDINRIKANYTQQIFEEFNDINGSTFNNTFDAQARRAIINGDGVPSVYSLYNGAGTIFGGYNLSNNDQFRLTGQVSTDIKNHSIQLGFEAEQRIDRFYGLAPEGLWSTAQRLGNAHLNANRVNKNSGTTVTNGNEVFVNYNYDIDTATYNNSGFAKNLRESMGLQSYDYIDIHNLKPDDLKLSYFSVSELVNENSQQVAYSGYDYLGNRVKGKTSFYDYFTDSANRPIAPYQPIYLAGYIQDKFKYKDIIFNIGVRVDRFDANQPVLKDKFSLYEVKTKDSYDGALNFTNNGVHPGNIGDKFVVYVRNSNESQDGKSEIIGYRNGDQFYDALGTPLQNADVLAASSTRNIPNPAIANSEEQIGDNGFKVSKNGFTDYNPQINFMPRVSFSFPISKVAVFYANYDVLVSRPQSNNVANASDYFFLATQSGPTINNTALRPEKNTNYQLGFKQALSQSSSINFTAYYRQLKDNVQFVTVRYAYPKTYNTYDNLDFGTVKGFTISYDLRRTNNIRLGINYTLQFASGTGSSSTSTANLNSLGLPRILTPTYLDFDQRHNVTSTIDYRYGVGEDYNGPSNMKWLFEDLGANFIARFGTGTPYTQQSNFNRENAEIGGGDARTRVLKGGGINTARLPSQFRLDFKIDKNIPLSDTKSGKKEYILNVNLQINNLLNSTNVIRVYNSTGNADDNGFISSPSGQQYIQSGALSNPQSYVDYYAVKINNPNNYINPRTIRLGLGINF